MDEYFSLRVSLKVSLPNHQLLIYPDDLLSPPFATTQWNRMGISFINRIFLPDLILAPPAAKHFIALDHKREAKFQIKPSLHLQYCTFISNFSQQLSRGKKRIFPVPEKERKGKRRNYHTRNVDIISHNDEIILLHEN